MSQMRQSIRRVTIALTIRYQDKIAPDKASPDKITRTKSPWTKSPLGQNPPRTKSPWTKSPSIFYILLTVVSE